MARYGTARAIEWMREDPSRTGVLAVKKVVRLWTGNDSTHGLLMLVIAFGRLVGFVIDGDPVQQALTAFGFEIVIAAGLYYASRRLPASAQGTADN